MKNVKLLIERQDVHNHVRSILKTAEFQKSYDEGGFVWQIVDKFADLPRYFFDASSEELETAHFSAWWGGIQNRTYDNDMVHDLYLIHEIYHAATMIYVPDMEYQNFCRKLVDNELHASVCSEIQAYFELPGIRAKSFKHEIFADRFLNDPYYQDRWTRDRERVIEEFAILRRNVMNSQTPKDRMEFWIHKFAYQNEAWNSIWYDRYNLVEKAMIRLRDESHTISRAQAMKNFMSWLMSPEIAQGTDIPFPQEAKAFAGVYWKNKAIYNAEHNVQQPKASHEQDGAQPPSTPKPPAP